VLCELAAVCVVTAKHVSTVVGNYVHSVSVPIDIKFVVLFIPLWTTAEKTLE